MFFLLNPGSLALCCVYISLYPADIASYIRAIIYTNIQERSDHHTGVIKAYVSAKKRKIAKSPELSL
jgi:hypothetical protein